MFIGWFDCRTSVDLRAHTSSCTDKPSMQDCTEGKKKNKKTLKHVVKRLTPFWVTHTQRYDTSPLAVCASSAPHTSCDCFTTRKKVYLDRSTYRSSEELWFLQAAQQTLCALFVLVWFLVDEVIQQWITLWPHSLSLCWCDVRLQLTINLLIIFLIEAVGCSAIKC